MEKIMNAMNNLRDAVYGIVGLGIMGKPMSKNLIKAGHELVVCDFHKDAVAELVGCGAKAPTQDTTD